MSLSESNAEAVLRAASAADALGSIRIENDRFAAVDGDESASCEIDDDNAASLVEMLCSAAHADFRNAWRALEVWMRLQGADVALDDAKRAFSRGDSELTVPQIVDLIERFDDDDDMILVAAEADGSLSAYVNCSDFFAWACADGETITLEMYREIVTLADEHVGDDLAAFYVPLLAATRARRKPPISPRLERMPEHWRELFVEASA